MKSDTELSGSATVLISGAFPSKQLSTSNLFFQLSHFFSRTGVVYMKRMLTLCTLMVLLANLLVGITIPDGDDYRESRVLTEPAREISRDVSVVERSVSEESGEHGGSWFDDLDDEDGITEKKGVEVENGFVYSNWLNGWKYRRKINLSNPGDELSVYQLQVNLTQDNFDYGDAGENGEDIRFIDAGGNSLSYWIENWDTNDASSIWLNVSSIPNGDSAIHLYYGNGDAHNESNASKVFLLYDDFDDGIWTDKWNETRSDGTSYSSESDGTLKVVSKGGDDFCEELDSKATFEVPFVYEARYKWTSGYVGRFRASSVSPLLSYVLMECTRYSSDWRVLNIYGGIGPEDNQYFSFTDSWKEYRMMLQDEGGNGTAVLRAGNTLDTWEDTVSLACEGKPSDYSAWRGRLDTTHHSSYGSETLSEYDWVRVRKYALERPGHTISSREEAEADQYIESEDIFLALNGEWDAVSVNLEEGGYGKTRLSVIDASTGEVVPGFNNLEMRNIDISGLNDLGIATIRIRANVLDAGLDVPVIDSWGVEWVKENTWRDAFTGDGKSTVHSPVDEHTVGYWNFDDGTARDLAGDNHGTHYGNTRLLMHFDEGEGQETADESPYENHGQLGESVDPEDNDPNWTDEGGSGGSLEFDGVDDFIYLADDPSLEIGTRDFTLEAWVKTAGSSDSNPIIFEKYSNLADVYRFGILGIGTDPEYPSIWIRDGPGGNTATATSSVAVNDDVWHHIVGTQ